MTEREMVCPYCKHRIYTQAPDPIYCGPHRASVGPNEYPRVQMVERIAISQDKRGNET